MSCISSILDESVPDTIPLTGKEKTLKAQLESIVDNGLEKFLQVGQALAELRNKRLYRTEFPTFEAYIQSRFHLHRASVDGVIRSAETAQLLIDSGVELAPDTTATSLRAISALPEDAQLKTACWQLAQTLSPARAPSQPLVSRLCRIVRNCLDDAPQEDFGEPEPADEENPASRNGAHFRFGLRRRQVTSPERETPFIRPVERLASWSGFSVEVIVSSVKPPSALILFRACSVLTDRLKQVQERLAANYPELVVDA